MDNLILNSLEIHNFRAFEHLQIERLGRVNLIVGKNNVGKTCLLEALQLYAQRGSPRLILEQLRSHDESKQAQGGYWDAEELLSAFKYMFHGRPDVRTPIKPIEMGPINDVNSALTIALDWWYAVQSSEGIHTMQLLQPEEYNQPVSRVPRLTVQLGKQTIYNLLLDSSLFTALPVLSYRNSKPSMLFGYLQMVCTKSRWRGYGMILRLPIWKRR